MPLLDESCRFKRPRPHHKHSVDFKTIDRLLLFSRFSDSLKTHRWLETVRCSGEPMVRILLNDQSIPPDPAAKRGGAVPPGVHGGRLRPEPRVPCLHPYAPGLLICGSITPGRKPTLPWTKPRSMPSGPTAPPNPIPRPCSVTPEHPGAPDLSKLAFAESSRTCGPGGTCRTGRRSKPGCCRSPLAGMGETDAAINRRIEKRQGSSLPLPL